MVWLILKYFRHVGDMVIELQISFATQINFSVYSFENSMVALQWMAPLQKYKTSYLLLQVQMFGFCKLHKFCAILKFHAGHTNSNHTTCWRHVKRRLKSTGLYGENVPLPLNFSFPHVLHSYCCDELKNTQRSKNAFLGLWLVHCP